MKVKRLMELLGKFDGESDVHIYDEEKICYHVLSVYDGDGSPSVVAIDVEWELAEIAMRGLHAR